MCTPTTNPASISIQAGTTIHVVCMSHAAYFQQVILSLNQNMTNPIGTFSGTGENVAMVLANGQSLLSIPTGSNTMLYAKFNFSKTGSQGPFIPAPTVCTPVVQGQAPGPVFTTVTSEDFTDSDANDSYLTVIDLSTTDASVEGKVKGARG